MKLQEKVVLILLSVVTMTAAPQSSLDDPTGRDTQARGYWVDPSTGLMWAGRDNGKDVSLGGAVKYCRNLRLAGFSDWRLANMVELQGIYDKTVNAPGLAGPRKKQRSFTWHVKGNLFLTGDQWTTLYPTDNRRHPENGYQYYFDYNEGKPNDQPSGWPYPNDGMRALCVRGPEK
jgi:hypothetical protein